MFASHRKGCSSRPRNPSRKRARRAWLHCEELESRLAPSVSVLSYRNDLASTGLNSGELQLTPANVQVGSFGKLFATALDGQAYAQPLVDPGVTILDGVNTRTGAAGVHDVVFVATEHDSLYAIDAGVGGGAVLWQRSFLDATNPTGDINNTLNATAITAVPAADVNSSDLSPEIGITGTPVIDPDAGLLYLVTKTKETVGGAAHYVQRLHAINISDGTDAAAPALIGDTANGNTNNTLIYVYGSGDGSVTDPYNGTGKPVVQFNALREHQRSALSMVNHAVYVAWASHGDSGPYHGWVVAWDVSNAKTTGLQIQGVFNTSPNDGESGIWQSGGKVAFEADGSALYVETGNGTGGAPTLNADGFPADGDYNEAVLKVVADPATTPTNQNPNGWGLRAADYFIPYNVSALDAADLDLGSGGPMLLPDSAGLPGHPHLLVAAGKEGKIYLLDRDNLGHYDGSNDHALNAVPDGSGHHTPPKQLGGAFSTPAYLNGTLYWVSGYSSYTYAYAINADGTLSITSQTAVNSFGYLPGSVVASADGTSNGIVWVMDRNTNRIRAYSATTLATELWNSGQKAADALGAVIKFASPTVANGEVYVGTGSSLEVYGLTPPANAVPSAPVLSAMALSATSVNLNWTDSTAAPNTATGYKIEQSTDNSTFTQVTTAPAGATSLAIGGLMPQTKYYFRIRGFNGLGDSSDSNTASATTTTQVAVLDFSNGFAGSNGPLQYNGTAAVNGTRAELTNGGTQQAGSISSASPVDITQFNSQFTFQLTAGSNTADGFTFTIQGIAATALGPPGGGLGYGGGSGGIAKSAAIKFDLFNNSGEGANSTGLYTGGAVPGNAGSIDLTPSGVDLHSGHPFQVNLSYDGTALTVVIRDATTGAATSQSYAINIPATVGSSTAYVGFTGGTGGITATQDILTWSFAPNTPAAPNAPSGLGGTPTSATSIHLNWTNNATNQTGFHLDRATDPGFTQNLISQTLPAGPNSFTDSASGLAPGGTFYYRLRAFNPAGDSANSNVASVAIPVAPAKPTNQQVLNVTTAQIDLSWQDNAGLTADGYEILRAADHGAFAQVATLPATSRTPPSTYVWSDTNLTAGTVYEYHILAYNVSGSNDFAGVNATTLTLPPAGVSATAGNGAVILSWATAAGAQSYNIYRAAVPGQEVLLIQGVTAASYTDANVTRGVTYYYTVTAVNANATNLPGLPSESDASSEVSATVPRAIQSVTFGRLDPQTYGVGPIPLSASASSGLPVSFAVLSGPATLSGSSLQITGVGRVVVEASQAGNANYLPATPVDQSFIIAPAAQSIAFAAVADQTYGVAPIALEAGASSGLPVSFAVISGPAALSGNRLQISGAGTVVVEASQAGNANYLAAMPIDYAFTVAPAVLTITPDAGQSKAYGSAMPTLALTAGGFVNGDSASLLTGAIGITATAASPVGNYAFTLGTLGAGGNYRLKLADGAPTFAVTPATLTVAAAPAARPFGLANPAFMATISGFGNGDNAAVVSGRAILTTPATAISAPGTYDIQVDVRSLSSANYRFQPVNATLTVKASEMSTLAAVGTGPASVVFVVTPGHALFRHDDATGWAKLGDGILGVSAVAEPQRGEPVVFAVTQDQALFRHDALGGWQPLGGSGTIADISAGSDAAGLADVFVRTTTDRLTQWSGTSGWRAAPIGAPGTIVTFSATSLGRVVVVTGGHALLEHDDPFGWLPLSDGSFAESARATTDASGNTVVFALTPDDRLFRHDDPKGWTKLGDNLRQISAGTDHSGLASVWALTARGDLAEHSMTSGWHVLTAPGETARLSAATSDRVFLIEADGSVFGHDETAGFFPLAGRGFAAS